MFTIELCVLLRTIKHFNTDKKNMVKVVSNIKTTNENNPVEKTS